MSLHQVVRSMSIACLLAAAAISLSGCVVVPVGSGWYYGHPYRWR